MTKQLAYSDILSTDPFDDLWEATHPKGTSSWEEDEDIPDYEKPEYEE